MGGVAGHMKHLYEDASLTFRDILDILDLIGEGNLVGTEKTDGQNLFMTYNLSTGEARAARSKGDMNNGGLAEQNLAEKFSTHAHAVKSFKNAFNIFEDFFRNAGKTTEIIFGSSGNNYLNLEILDESNPNLINYNNKMLVIHRTNLSKEQITFLEELTKTSDNIIVNPQRELPPPTHLVTRRIQLAINSFMIAHDLYDHSTIGDYLVWQFKRYLTHNNIMLSDPLINRFKEDCCDIIGTPAGPKRVRGLESRQIANYYHPAQKTTIMQLVKELPNLKKHFMAPLITIIYDLEVEALRHFKSVYIDDNDTELIRLRQLPQEIQKKFANNFKAIEFIQHHLTNLKGTNSISTAAEGFVFNHGGKTYKLTGGFAPLNQIAGLAKYGRRGITL